MPNERPQFYAGPNAELVNEVVDAAFAYRPIAGPAWEDALTIGFNDMVRAVDAAGGVGPESHFSIHTEMGTENWGNSQRLTENMQIAEGLHKEEESTSDDMLTWTWHDLSENLVAELIWTSDWYEWKKLHALELSKLKFFQYGLAEIIAESLPQGPNGPQGEIGYYRDYISRELESVFMYAAQNRAYNGLATNFWEQQYEYLSRGMWVCGWKGRWPHPGKFLVWCPVAS